MVLGTGVLMADKTGLAPDPYETFFFNGCTHSIWKLPGQGSNPSHCYDLCHSCGNTRSFNPECLAEAEPAHTDAERLQSFAPQWELLPMECLRPPPPRPPSQAPPSPLPSLLVPPGASVPTAPPAPMLFPGSVHSGDRSSPHPSELKHHSPSSHLGATLVTVCPRHCSTGPQDTLVSACS